jgi:DNA-binding CsgD family transcriptional regulator
MHRIFQSFVDGISESADAASLHAVLNETAAAFEFSMFAYFVLADGRNGPGVLVSNYPTAWTDHYMRCGYEQVDPVIVQARSMTDPFHWGRGSAIGALSPAQAGFMEEAECHGIRCGFTVPVRDRSARLAAMTFAGHETVQSFRRSVERHGRVLQLMAIYLNRQARWLLGSGRMVDGVRLTEREFSCLSWAAQGKSTWEIGKILDIKRRTAAFHLDNARAKLGVHSIAQAVALFAAVKPPR